MAGGHNTIELIKYIVGFPPNSKSLDGKHDSQMLQSTEDLHRTLADMGNVQYWWGPNRAVARPHTPTLASFVNCLVVLGM